MATDVEGETTLARTRSALAQLYPEGYAGATMREVLLAVGLTEEENRVVCSSCESTMNNSIPLASSM